MLLHELPESRDQGSRERAGADPAPDVCLSIPTPLPYPIEDQVQTMGIDWVDKL